MKEHGSIVNRRGFLGVTLGSAAAITGGSSVGRSGPPERGGRRETYSEQLETPIVARHQVVVAGGGPSGLIAALAATRSGADTLLIERHACVGGTGTADLVSWYNGFRERNSSEAA